MQKLSKVFFRAVLLFLFLSPGISPTLSAQFIEKSVKDSADNANKKGFTVQPVIRVGAGMLSYIGNVKIGSSSTTIQSPSSGRPGYDIGLAQKISPAIEFSLNFLYGNVAVTEQTTDAIWNFQSTLMGGGINLLFKILPKQEVSPYIIIGVESYQFSSKANIYDQYGDEYYAWSDGTLRSLPQSSPSAASAKILNLNYNYSSDVASLNLSGAGTYNQQTFAIPVGLGFMFRLSDRTDFMIGSTLHYTFTDHIDGLTPQVQGPLKGTTSNDMFVFTYVSLRFNIIGTHRSHWTDDLILDTTNLLRDTLHADMPGHFDTSDAALQLQYEKYMDSTGQFAEHHVDPFHWKVANPVGTKGNVTNYPAKPVTPTISSAAPTTPVAPVSVPVTPAPVTPTATPPVAPVTETSVTPVTAATNSGIVIYKIQLLATRVKLADGVSFAGTNGKADVEDDNGLYRYTTGNFTSQSEAENYLNTVKAAGYTDAFIRVEQNDKNVPAAEVQSPAKPNVAPAETAVAARPGAKSGLVFKVQLGVFSNASPDQNFMSLLNQFKDVSIIKDRAGLNHYLVGSYGDYQSASSERDQVKAAGFKDACVMAFYNGYYISMPEAMSLQKK